MDEDTGLVRASVAYPLGGERTHLLYGGVLTFAGVAAVGLAVLLTQFVDPVLVVPVAVLVVLAGLVPLLGHLAAVMRVLLDDEADPPRVGDWSATLRDGRRMAGLLALFAAPAVLLATVAVALGGPGGSTLSLATAILAGLFALLAAYVLPAALVVVVETGEPAAAWNAELLREAVADGDYFASWVLGGAFATVGVALGVPLHAVVVGPVVLFAAELSAVHALTHGVVRSLDITLEEPPAPPASGYVPGWEDGDGRRELTDGRYGGSLLPTTPDDDEPDEEPEETPPTPGGVAAAGGGDDAGDIEPYEEPGDEIERKRDGDG